ncbi:MAG: plasmid replication protein RepC [Halopseudomonas aestusnigri]
MEQRSICVGQRNFTPQIRAMAKVSDLYSGLPQGVDRFEILKYLKIAGSEFGFKARHLSYLAYLIGFTSEIDWSEETYHPPIVWQSVSNTAQDFGTSERQINRWEKELHNLGALTWRDSGNHKHYGVRSDDGHIKFGYGIDLSPLAALFAHIKLKAEKVLRERRIWKEAKRELSALKRRVRTKMCVAELSIDEFSELQPITASTTLSEIHTQQEKLTLIEIAVDNHFEKKDTQRVCGKDVKMSPQADKNVRHIYTTTKLYSSKEDTSSSVDKGKGNGVQSRSAGFSTHISKVSPQKGNGISISRKFTKGPVDIKASTGVEHLTTSMLISVASDGFKDKIPRYDRALAPEDLVEAAWVTCAEIGINRYVWNEAVQVMGALAAAISVMVTDVNQQHPERPVLNPGGFLRGMIKAAKAGELQLHKSVFGIMERDYCLGL